MRYLLMMLFYILALICFALATFNRPLGRLDLIATGLLLFTAGTIARDF